MRLRFAGLSQAAKTGHSYRIVTEWLGLRALNTTQFKKIADNLPRWMESNMRRDVLFPLMLATLLLAAIFVIAPKSAIVADEASSEMSAIDIVGLTKSAMSLPEQRFDAH